MKKTAFVLGFLLLATVSAEADQRDYVWTYQYLTLPKGGTEVEYYFTQKTKDASQPGKTDYEHQLEFEYGVTDRWDVALYQVFGKKDRESLDYSGYKLRTRYRFGERGQYPVDTLLYLEYKAKVDKKDAVEGKLVIAKDIGKFNMAYNQIMDLELGRGGEVEHEYAAGISYQIHHALRIGVEGAGSYTGREHAVGPTVSWVAGRFWTSLGVAFGLNRRTDDRQVRFIVGVPF
ncbi:MAG: hypothetical protein M1353_12260 [Nitrospirae bacterium]|nr:hypothetical protein [Nitrospirota bacterium]